MPILSLLFIYLHIFNYQHIFKHILLVHVFIYVSKRIGNCSPKSYWKRKSILQLTSWMKKIQKSYVYFIFVKDIKNIWYLERASVILARHQAIILLEIVILATNFMTFQSITKTKQISVNTFKNVACNLSAISIRIYWCHISHSIASGSLSVGWWVPVGSVDPSPQL